MIGIEMSRRLLSPVKDRQQCKKILVTVPGLPNPGGRLLSLKEMPPLAEETAVGRKQRWRSVTRLASGFWWLQRSS